MTHNDQSDADSHESAPDTLGRFEVEGELGKGGMGSVLLCRDPMIDRQLAVKVVKFDDETDELARKDLIDRFFVEAKAAGKLTHPNIVTIYDVGEADQLPFIAMEYVKADDLSHVIAREGSLSTERAVNIATQIASALSFAHEHGVIHRDIKPANILLKDGDRVKVTDFGLARVQTVSAITRPGLLVGSPSFMSPEQVRGEELDGRSDIFSLGVLLYEMIAGERPFRGEAVTDLMFKIVNEEPPAPSALNPGVDEAFDQVVMKMLAKDKNERYTSCGEVEEALLAITGGSPGYVTGGGRDDEGVTIAEPEEETGTLVMDRSALEKEAAKSKKKKKKRGRALPLFFLLIAVTALSFFAYRHSPEFRQAVKPYVGPLEPYLPIAEKEITELYEKVKPMIPKVTVTTGETAKPEGTPPSLSVTSKPPGATVVIDGEEKGVTPVTLADLTPGDRKVVLKLDGYGDETVEVSLAENKETALAVTLKEALAYIEISGPAGATIYLGKEKLGHAPLTRSVKPGKHKLAVYKKEHKPYGATITLKAGETYRPSITLEKEKKGFFDFLNK